MPRGDKSSYTPKQKRKAEHIEDGYRKRGVTESEAERRAWATVNQESGGGKLSGSGRGRPENRSASRKGGKLGGPTSASPPSATRRSPTRKSSPRKSVAAKSATNKTAASKAPARKSAASRSSARKTLSRKTMARKTPPRKTSAKKAVRGRKRKAS